MIRIPALLSLLVLLAFFIVTSPRLIKAQYETTDPPGPFKQLSPLYACLAPGSAVLQVRWQSSVNVVQYRITVKDRNGAPEQHLLVDKNTLYRNFTLGNSGPLQPGHEYTFRIRAQNSYGVQYSDQSITFPQGLWSHEKYGTYTTYLTCNPPAAFNFSAGSPSAACLALDSPASNIDWSVTDANYYMLTPKVNNNLAKDNYATPAGFNPDAGGSIANNLLSYWNLDQASNPISDLKGNNPGTTSNTSLTTGKVGNARSFSTPGNLIQTPAVNLNLSDYTAAAWINTLGINLTNSCGQTILNQSGNTDLLGITSIPYDAGDSNVICDGELRLSVTLDLQGKGDRYSNVFLPANTWVFVAATRNSSTGQIKLYINGSEVPGGSFYSTAPGPLINQSLPINIGGMPSYPSTWYRGIVDFRGVIDEVGLWNRELTAQEVNDLFNFTYGNTYTLAGTNQDGILQSIKINNPPPGNTHSYTHPITGSAIAGETWQYYMTAYNDWGSTNATTNPSPTTGVANCAAPTLNFSVDYIPVDNQQSGVKVNAIADYPNTILTTKSGNSIDLKWSTTNANSCRGSNTLADTQPTSMALLTQGPLINPPDTTKLYTLSCTNTNLPSSVTERTRSKTVGINIDTVKPYIQTRGGDVHTNKQINIPGD